MPGLTLWRRLLGRADPVESGVGPGPHQHLVLSNAGTRPLEVMIEVYPNRYVLQPRAEMVIEACLDGARFDITVYPDGLQIYAGNDIDPKVTIDGAAVDPDWHTPVQASD